MALAREAAQGALDLNGPDHLHTATTQLSLALALEAVEEWDNALAASQRALAIYTAILGEDSSENVMPLMIISRAHRNLGRLGEARRKLDQARALPLPVNPGLDSELQLEFATLLWSTGDRVEARRWATEAAETAAPGECSFARNWLAARPVTGG